MGLTVRVKPSDLTTLTCCPGASILFDSALQISPISLMVILQDSVKRGRQDHRRHCTGGGLGSQGRRHAQARYVCSPREGSALLALCLRENRYRSGLLCRSCASPTLGPKEIRVGYVPGLRGAYQAHAP